MRTHLLKCFIRHRDDIARILFGFYNRLTNGLAGNSGMLGCLRCQNRVAFGLACSRVDGAEHWKRCHSVAIAMLGSVGNGPISRQYLPF